MTVPVGAQGTLALDFRLPSGVPAVPVPPAPPALTVLPGGRTDEAVAAGSVPDVRDWAARFVQAIVEVMAGDRPLTQLVRWTDERVYANLSRRVRLVGITTTAAGRGRTARPYVRSLRLCPISPDIVEVAVHIHHGARSRAVAARLEVYQERWLCTALELG